MRKTIRVQQRGEVRFRSLAASESESSAGAGTLQDASTGGVCFITDKGLFPGDRIEMSISSGGARIAVKGTVMHTHGHGKGIAVGIRFDIDDPETEEALHELATLGQE
jgi:hypothetical protein